LEFTHITPVEPETAASFTRQAAQVIEAQGGRYEDWGGGVVD
jgi:hypothetical protein